MRRLTRALAPVALMVPVAILMLVTPARPASAAASSALLQSLERDVLGFPESLKAAADYRQQAIAERAYDRAIEVFERLSKRPGAGANAFLNLAFAYVDKVPVSGSIRQALLGRDAIRALTRAIEIAPSDLAFFVRGLVNLYYDRAIFHRTDKGVADLEEARRIASLNPSVAYMPRILQALGDGYFRLDQRDKARLTWREGLSIDPGNVPIRARLDASEEQLGGIVGHALDADVRVDTSLKELDLASPRTGASR
jgi:tetratricopeptide (TPR) repeat protein